MLCFRCKLVLKKEKEQQAQQASSKPTGQQAQQSHRLHALPFLLRCTGLLLINELHVTSLLDRIACHFLTRKTHDYSFIGALNEEA